MAKILAIDDKQDNLITISALLKNLVRDCTVILAESGADGIAMAAKERPDTILLDIIMPGMDGFETCRRLKSDPETRHIPVILITAIRTDAASRIKGFDAGADAFLSKPIDETELVAQVNVMLRIKGAEDILRAQKEDLEESVREGNRRFRSLVDSTSDGIVICDQNGLITQWNNGAEILFGYHGTEIIGKSIELLVSDTDQEPPGHFFENRIQSQVESQNGRVLEAEGIKRDGSRFPLELSLSSWVSDGNRIFATITRDITERKKLHEALQQYEIIVSGSSDMQALLNDSFDYLTVNKAYADAFDLQVDDLAGKNAIDIFGESFFNGTIRPNAEKCLKGEVVKFSEWFQFTGKKRQYMEVTYYPYHKNGKISGFFVNGRNNTERMQAEMAMQKSEERMRTMFEEAPMGIALVDAKNGTIREANSRFLEITGIKKEQIGRIDWMSLTHSDDLKEDQGLMGRLNGGEISSYKTNKRYVHPDGGVTWVKKSVAPIRISDSEEMGCLFMVEDISESKIAEQETARLEEQLLQAQKMEAIGTLAGGIAHDFNNILGVIMGYTEITIDEPEDPVDVRENLAHVLNASIRAKEMIQQILAFSRKDDQSKGLISVGKIIKETISFLRSSIPSTIEIHSDIQKGLGMINGNGTQINQILMNLCTNAAHAMILNGGTLSILLKKVTLETDKAEVLDLETGNYLELTIVDTGIGMKKEVMDRIFEPYFTTKKNDEGTGMGLAVVYGIVHNHGGGIQVSSTPGKGTVFQIYFPTIEQKLDIPEMRERSVSTGKNEHILFVDDERSLVEMGTQLLKRIGYRVTSCSSSVDALDLFAGNADHFDLVITDMTMPNMTGTRLAEEIRKIRPDIPIILCTGFSHTLDFDNLERYGVEALIMKPFVKNQIAETIRDVLNNLKKSRRTEA